MQVIKNSVVSINYELHDMDGELLEKTEEPVSYLHGGYDGIFPIVEEQLHNKSVGDKVELILEPDDAFGEYDAELVRIEPRHLFPDNVEVGMQFEGGAEGDEDDYMLYTVTDVTPDKVAVDGNHPWAGQRLKFSCTVTDVRPATKEEIEHEHVHGAGGHHHH